MLLLILPSELHICEGLFNESITFRFPETISIFTDCSHVYLNLKNLGQLLIEQK